MGFTIWEKIELMNKVYWYGRQVFRVNEMESERIQWNNWLCNLVIWQTEEDISTVLYKKWCFRGDGWEWELNRGWCWQRGFMSYELWFVICDEVWSVWESDLSDGGLCIEKGFYFQRWNRSVVEEPIIPMSSSAFLCFLSHLLSIYSMPLAPQGRTPTSEPFCCHMTYIKIFTLFL